MHSATVGAKFFDSFIWIEIASTEKHFFFLLKLILFEVISLFIYLFIYNYFFFKYFSLVCSSVLRLIMWRTNRRGTATYLLSKHFYSIWIDFERLSNVIYLIKNFVHRRKNIKQTSLLFLGLWIYLTVNN
jgi:hypothetical protein